MYRSIINNGEAQAYNASKSTPHINIISEITEDMKTIPLNLTHLNREQVSPYPPLTEQGPSGSRRDREGVSEVTQSMQASSLTRSAPSASASRAPALRAPPSLENILNPPREESSGSRRDRGGVPSVTQAMRGATLTTTAQASAYGNPPPPPTKKDRKGKGPEKRSPPEPAEEQGKKHRRQDRRPPRGGGSSGSVGRA